VSRRPKSLVRRHVVAVSSGGAPICVGGRKQISLNGGSDEELCSPRRRMLGPRCEVSSVAVFVLVSQKGTNIARLAIGIATIAS